MDLSKQPARSVTKESQTHKNRLKPRRGVSGKFSAKTIKIIKERDGWRCVRCGSYYIEPVPHHIIYRSQGGPGTVDNGVCVCPECHRLAHSSRAVRKWFEEYRTKYLLGDETA
ncbi:HNH endonuclease [Paenibacillus sp. CAU 1782]